MAIRVCYNSNKRYIIKQAKEVENMKKLLFGISLILTAIFIAVLDMGYDLPDIFEFLYIILPIAGIGFSIFGLIEREN